MIQRPRRSLLLSCAAVVALFVGALACSKRTDGEGLRRAQLERALKVSVGASCDELVRALGAPTSVEGGDAATLCASDACARVRYLSLPDYSIDGFVLSKKKVIARGHWHVGPTRSKEKRATTEDDLRALEAKRALPTCEEAERDAAALAAHGYVPYVRAPAASDGVAPGATVKGDDERTYLAKNRDNLDLTWMRPGSACAVYLHANAYNQGAREVAPVVVRDGKVHTIGKDTSLDAYFESAPCEEAPRAVP
jgi:hypothetical protein